MIARKRLQDRRHSETFEFEHNGMRYVATFSRFADGRLGEIFVNNHKAGSAADANARMLQSFVRSRCSTACRSTPSAAH